MTRWLAVGLLTLLAGCTPPERTVETEQEQGSQSAAAGTVSRRPTVASPTKVLLLMEENTHADDALGAGSTPYLDSVLDQAARMTRMDAGYPPRCPSLPAYLLLTSGSTHGVCDSGDPDEHPLGGPNLFEQVAGSGREWRVYAEGMEHPCQRQDSDDGRYVVRHTAAPYYLSETDRCEHWQVALGNESEGALQQDLASGLAAFSLVVPDLCHDMHGARGCRGDRVEEGDAWLSRWLPRVQGSADYRSGDLLVVLTWDEGSDSSNEIPTLALHPSVAGTTVDTPLTHCDTLRTMSEVLGVPPLGCAGQAAGLLSFSGAGTGPR
jgi:hypothetical protein